MKLFSSKLKVLCVYCEQASWGSDGGHRPLWVSCERLWRRLPRSATAGLRQHCPHHHRWESTYMYFEAYQCWFCPWEPAACCLLRWHPESKTCSCSALHLWDRNQQLLSIKNSNLNKLGILWKTQWMCLFHFTEFQEACFYLGLFSLLSEFLVYQANENSLPSVNRHCNVVEGFERLSDPRS